MSLPKNMDSTTRDLVQKILVADTEMRLGIPEIKSHQFFAGVDWDAAEALELYPPFVPDTRSEIQDRFPHATETTTAAVFD